MFKQARNTIKKHNKLELLEYLMTTYTFIYVYKSFLASYRHFGSILYNHLNIIFKYGCLFQAEVMLFKTDALQLNLANEPVKGCSF